MAIPIQFQPDADAILAKRHDHGADDWTTLDRRLIKGSPFSMLDCMYLLTELGMDPHEAPLKNSIRLLWEAQREDGRFKLSPTGAIYPCHTIHAARILCCLGAAGDPRLQKTYDHLLANRFSDGGWRCNKFSFGRGPKTDFPNPGPTLTALDVFRFTPYAAQGRLDEAVAFLLDHWQTRKPLGPCHYGIGTLFMQTAYPFANYNLFYYVYVLSFYEKARNDPRFREALGCLQSKLREEQIVVERVHPKLSQFAFCKKGQASELATARYREILVNITRSQ